jgi:hypothetical protein
MQLNEDLVRQIYEWKTMGLGAKRWRENEGIKLSRKYQIKELFWEKRNCREQ